MKTLVIGDIHGAHKALRQCLDRSGFDPQKDRLILLGDICDGYPEVRQCIDELLKFKHCKRVLGNHDQWALDWALRGDKQEIWMSQGGEGTFRSYGGGPMPEPHIRFLKEADLWLEMDGRLFVHGGFDPDIPIQEQPAETLLWDRTLINKACEKNDYDPSYRFGGYKEIFLGHTPTGIFDSSRPLKLCNVWAMDTGAGWSGKLTVMDVETKKYWQSDPTPLLYGFTGRR